MPAATSADAGAMSSVQLGVTGGGSVVVGPAVVVGAGVGGGAVLGVGEAVPVGRVAPAAAGPLAADRSSPSLQAATSRTAADAAIIRWQVV